MKKHAHWRRVALAEVAEIQTGLSKSSNRKGDFVRLPFLRVANVQDGYFDLSEIKEIDVPRETLERFRVKKGDVLLTEGGDFNKLGRGAIWDGQIDPCVHQNHIFVVRPNKEILNKKFFALQTSSARGRAYFQSCAKQSTNLASINTTQLRQFPTLLPPLREQERIASILGSWERAIGTLQSLIAAKSDRKRSLLQQLLTGRVKLPGFRGKWPARELGDVAENCGATNRGKHGWDRLYGVTKADGMTPMREHVRGISTERCKLVKSGWFAYNPMRLNIGSLARWQGDDEVMVSGDYVVFRCLDGQLDPRYFDHLRRSRPWSEFVNKSGTGSVRVRLYFKDIARFKFLCPPIEEQSAIADLLDTCDREIALHREQLEALREQKRGLMQKLLTGEIRVNI